jgi:hypothetical protein
MGTGPSPAFGFRGITIVGEGLPPVNPILRTAATSRRRREREAQRAPVKRSAAINVVPEPAKGS